LATRIRVANHFEHAVSRLQHCRAQIIGPFRRLLAQHHRGASDRKPPLADPAPPNARWLAKRCRKCKPSSNARPVRRFEDCTNMAKIAGRLGVQSSLSSNRRCNLRRRSSLERRSGAQIAGVWFLRTKQRRQRDLKSQVSEVARASRRSEYSPVRPHGPSAFRHQIARVFNRAEERI